ncbi:hypothetical protein C8R46DRAFT_1308489 [Mycena filopes]|nr:hypothetical protein C8R46DRAFT_1308489 [Mycena filopes]
MASRKRVAAAIEAELTARTDGEPKAATEDRQHELKPEAQEEDAGRHDVHPGGHEANEHYDEASSEGGESGSEEAEAPAWTCDCGQAARQLVAGANAKSWNRGRPFAKCATQSCDYWTWCDDTRPETRQRLFNESMDARFEAFGNYGEPDADEYEDDGPQQAPGHYPQGPSAFAQEKSLIYSMKFELWRLFYSISDKHFGCKMVIFLLAQPFFSLWGQLQGDSGLAWFLHYGEDHYDVTAIYDFDDGNMDVTDEQLDRLAREEAYERLRKKHEEDSERESDNDAYSPTESEVEYEIQKMIYEAVVASIAANKRTCGLECDGNRDVDQLKIFQKRSAAEMEESEVDSSRATRPRTTTEENGSGATSEVELASKAGETRDEGGGPKASEEVAELEGHNVHLEDNEASEHEARSEGDEGSSESEAEAQDYDPDNDIAHYGQDYYGEDEYDEGGDPNLNPTDAQLNELVREEAIRRVQEKHEYDTDRYSDDGDYSATESEIQDEIQVMEQYD